MNGPFTAWAIRDAIRRGERSALEVCREALDRIARVDGALHAVLTLCEETALAEAASLDSGRAAAGMKALLGVPIAVKDNICTRGTRTTAGSRILERYVPPYDATVIERLREAGAIVVAKTNCDEFAMGSSNENSAFGPARNPWDPGRSPGGSSGGSAALVAARAVPVALGSDTGGSIRQPASFCGVVGLKPTYGRVSRYGLIAFGSSLDQIGPIASDVRDAALAYEAIAGPDERDATTSRRAVEAWEAEPDAVIAGLRIGVPRHLLGEGVEDDVRARFLQALAILEGGGATLVDIELPHAPLAIPTYYLVATAEASSNLARYDGVRYGRRAPLGAGADLDALYTTTRTTGFGPEVKRRILLGTYVLSAGYYDAFYLKASQVRTLIRRDYDQAFTRADVVAMPTAPTTAFPLGSRVDDPLQMYLSDVFTVSANLAGLPALSVPCGVAQGLPVGLQLTGRAFDETTLFRMAAACERAVPAAAPPTNGPSGA